MNFEYGAYTCRGRLRKRNEDSFFIPSAGDCIRNLAIVADGMGGHSAGDMASRTAVEVVLDYFKQKSDEINSLDGVRNAVSESIQTANRAIYLYSKTHGIYLGMGTTLTMVYFYKDRACIGHVGDSRCYLIRDGTVSQITRDHSLVQELLEEGRITEGEVDNHPQRNVITRALGTDAFVSVDYYEVSVKLNDIFLLCTDGLTYKVDISKNAALFTSRCSLEGVAAALVQMAVDSGSTDDITVVLARFGGSEAKE